MSHNLWRSFIEDDVESFRQYLANATYTSGGSKATPGGPAGCASFKIGSPGSLGTSPKTPVKSRKSSGSTAAGSGLGRSAGLILTRADVNTRDSFGRTILHHAASSHSEDAPRFVQALLEIPFIDLYAQDSESGWTALHRALYFGNVSIAQALMLRDVQDATDYTINAQHSHAGGLVKIKDHEGNSPFEVFGLTIAPRSLHTETATLSAGIRDDESAVSVDLNDESQDRHRHRRHVSPLVDLQGDEVFAFGSNKNLSLGLGDGDDRHFPERVHLVRPEHLLRRLYDDHLAARQRALLPEDLASSLASIGSLTDLPALIRHQALTIQDVVMSKLHTAILTNDPISNLYICGFGPGGRLGTGDETTSFHYKCIQGGGLAKRRISAVALGQDHTVAVCSQGEVFTWGSNRYGQLGYALPEVSAKEIPTQLVPRQLYGYIKKEVVIGAAASAIHSAVHTSSSLYTFGKNEGQLGLMDADARSLEAQIIPRRVGVSILQAPIQSVSAIDRATIVLLENHEVIVFTHYGWTKVVFPLEGFTNYFISEALTTKDNMERNVISKITGGGNTICAMSSFGEVYTIELPKNSESVPSSVSTTNPTKARNALPSPTRVWSIRKAHMSAIDVAVGQDGSVILCTASGSVWRKEKRANINPVRSKDGWSARPKDYKFVRIPNLTRALAVRSNAYGAFTAIRKDCHVTRDQIHIQSPSLWHDLFPLLPFANDARARPADDDESCSSPGDRLPGPGDISRMIITSPQSEEDILTIGKRYEPLSQSPYDIWITSNLTEVRIPVHSFLLKARSRVMRSALTEFQETYYYSIPDVVSIEYGQDGQVRVQFHGADFLTLVNLVFYLYTDNVVDVWHYTSQALPSAARYRAVRVELMKIASHLELRQLERAVRVMVDPARSLSHDMEAAVLDSDFFSDADVLIELADGAELAAHSTLLCTRCPFFDGLFNGRAGGIWMSSRRTAADENAEAVKVDLKHIEVRVFEMVLRHLYADTGDELFDDVVTKTCEELIDLVIDVMSVANELMLDRLAQICQKTLGKFVNPKNVCQLLSTVAECSVSDFKDAALEYICLNLESMLEQRLLDELDEELLTELDEVVQQNQLAFMPFARSGRAQADLLSVHPELVEQIEVARQRRIDSMRLRSRLVEDEERFINNKLRVGSLERLASSPLNRSILPEPDERPSPSSSPAMAPKDAGDDLPFNMDEDNATAATPLLTPVRASGRSSFSVVRPPPVNDDLSIADSLSRSPVLDPAQAPKLPRLDFQQLPSPGSSLSRPTNPSSPSSPSAVRVSGFELPKAAWQTTPRKVKTTDLKDIMEQASATRVSNLTKAMTSGAQATPKATPRMSQKERKRQQLQNKNPDNASPGATDGAVTSKSSTSPSPWQNFSPQQHKASTARESPAPDTPEGPGLSSMTMPQAGPGTVPVTATMPPKQVRTVSHPGLTPSTKPAPPQIQSIRHTPVPSRSPSAVDARTSMADILAQQQTEKTAIKEAVAKRSLQDIQQEQEFQEWWDNESRRVQEEEAQAKAAAARRGKAGRGRGGRGRGGGGRDKPSPGTPVSADQGRHAGHDQSVNETLATRSRGGSSSGSGSGSQRGAGRGRGQGR